MKDEDKELERLRLELAAGPEQADLALSLARAHGRRGERAEAIGAIRRGLAWNPNDATLWSELLERAPHLRAPWPGPNGAGTSASSASHRGARRHRLNRRFLHDADRGPPLVLEDGRVFRAGDGVIEELELDKERARLHPVPQARKGALRLLDKGLLLARGANGLSVFDPAKKTFEPFDKGPFPSEPRAVYHGPSGAIAIGRGPTVTTHKGRGDAGFARTLGPRTCRRAALFGGGETVRERLASAFAGDPHPSTELWIETQEPFISVENDKGFPGEVVRYTCGAEWWPAGSLPDQAPLQGEAERVDRLVAGPAGEPVVVAIAPPVAAAKEAVFMGGGVVAIPRVTSWSPIAYDARRRRVAAATDRELLVASLDDYQNRKKLPFGASAVAFDSEGWLYVLALRDDGQRLVPIDPEGRPSGNLALQGATEIAIGAGVTLGYGDRILYVVV